MAQLTIGMLVFARLQLLDLVAPLEVFASAPGLRPLLCAARREPVDLGRGLQLIPDAAFDELPAVDVLFVPGGGGIGDAIADPVTLDFLADRGRSARFVTSVCTGALVLGAAGLLRGYRATTHWRYLDLLREVGAEPVEARVVRDGNRITGGGITAGVDFGLSVVAELCGVQAAQTVQLQLEYHPAPPFSAGSPATAPAAVVAGILARTQGLHDQRAELLRRHRR